MRLSTETDRVEAFTDRVLAVILAIMVLELRAPHGTEPDPQAFHLDERRHR